MTHPHDPCYSASCTSCHMPSHWPTHTTPLPLNLHTTQAPTPHIIQRHGSNHSTHRARLQATIHARLAETQTTNTRRHRSAICLSSTSTDTQRQHTDTRRHIHNPRSPPTKITHPVPRYSAQRSQRNAKAQKHLHATKHHIDHARSRSSTQSRLQSP